MGKCLKALGNTREEYFVPHENEESLFRIQSFG